MNVNPYGACVKFRDGEMNSDELVALMAAWPFGPMPRTNDTNVIRATPWPGNVGCLYLALLDGVISEDIIRSIARGHTAHQARDGRVLAASLTGSEGGTWRVTTVGSRHLFDLEDFTIQRTAIVNGTPLRSGPLKRLTVLHSCQLFQTGLWTFHSEKNPSWIEWHQSSIITGIERLR